MDKRYQVFISSTFEDLKDERKEMIENLLNLKYFPAGMEMFSASNEEQFKYIKKIIDSCDYYILILGARYGSVEEKSGKSFTEMEYDYAIERGIPILSFVHSDPWNIEASKRESDNVELFKVFRDKVLHNSRMCKLWTQKSDLISAAIISLVQVVDEYPRVGWIRGDVVQASTEVLTQINQLRDENESLRKENEQLRKEHNEEECNEENELATGTESFDVSGIAYNIGQEFDPEFMEYFDTKINTSDEVCTVTWNDLFKKVAPDIFSPKKEYVFRQSINELFFSRVEKEQFEISKDSYITIKFQMLALGWIGIDENIEGDYIYLTEYGKKTFMDIITVKRRL